MKFKFTKEYKTGLLVIMATFMLVWGINFLKGKNIFETSNQFVTIYGNVDGLAESSIVYINGYKIGYISNIEFNPVHPDRFLVDLSINNEVLIPKGSIAQIFSIDIMGTRAVRIVPAQSNMYCANGDTIEGATEGDLKELVSNEIRPLKNKAESLIGQFDSVLVTLQTLFNDQAVENLRNSFTSIRNTIESLERASGAMDTLITSQSTSIAHILGNLDSLTTSMSNSRGRISSIIENIDDISGSLAEVNYKALLAEIDSTITMVNGITKTINDGDGSLGLLINDNQLYDNIAQTTANLEKLTLDIYQNPRKYIHLSAFDFGKTVFLDANGKRKKVYDTADNPHFKVLVQKSNNPIPVTKENFKKPTNIDELLIDKEYFYTLGDFVTFKDCNIFLEKVIEDYPQAYIIAVKNEKQVRLQKAMRKTAY